MANYHLWLDFETTGLEPAMDTILEAAWTITDSDLRMVTPLRSRLCLIDPPNRRRDSAHIKHPLGGVNTFKVGNGTEERPGHWSVLPDVVQDMHEKSGLRDALTQVVNRDPAGCLSVLSTAVDLGRLIKEDLLTAKFDPSADRLILSGAGVSHFDNRVFAHHLPGMFPLMGGGSFSYAYWQHDTSVAQRAIGERNWEALKSWVNCEKAALEVYGCQVVVEAEGYAPVRVNAVPGADEFGHPSFVFMPDEFTAHRAADDVAQALIDGRILRIAIGGSAK